MGGGAVAIISGMGWYANLSPERRAEVIAKAGASVERRRAAARERGECLCGGPLRMVRYGGRMRLSARCEACEACEEVRRVKRRASPKEPPTARNELGVLVSRCDGGHEAIWGSLATEADRAAWMLEHVSCAAPPPAEEEQVGPAAFMLAALLTGEGIDAEPYGERGVVARNEAAAVWLAWWLRQRGKRVVRTGVIVSLRS